MTHSARLCQTSSSGDVGMSLQYGLLASDNDTPEEAMTVFWRPEPRCYHDGFHTIALRHTKGSNQHVRRETGECWYCGKVYIRRVDWNHKAVDWWREEA